MASFVVLGGRRLAEPPNIPCGIGGSWWGDKLPLLPGKNTRNNASARTFWSTFEVARANLGPHGRHGAQSQVHSRHQ